MKRKWLNGAVLHTFLIAVSLCFILPLVMVISISVSSEDAISDFGYTLFPNEVSFDAYKLAFQNPQQLLNSYKTTIIFSLSATALSLLVQSMVAYPLSKKTYKHKKFVTIYIFITMLFSGGLVPSYILNTQYLHINNTIWIYIIPGLVGAWNIIVMRTFFQGLPDGLPEAAKIDGANEFYIYAKIILPLSKPVLATIGFMTLLAKWNDWNTSLIYIRKPELYSLQYLLQRILREVEYIKSLQNTQAAALVNTHNMPTESFRFAMAVLAAGPMLMIFPFFQKYVSKGLTIGAVKG